VASLGSVMNEYVPSTITAIMIILTSTGLSTEILKMDIGLPPVFDKWLDKSRRFAYILTIMMKGKKEISP